VIVSGAATIEGLLVLGLMEGRNVGDNVGRLVLFGAAVAGLSVGRVVVLDGDAIGRVEGRNVGHVGRLVILGAAVASLSAGREVVVGGGGDAFGPFVGGLVFGDAVASLSVLGARVGTMVMVEAVYGQEKQRQSIDS
jgi:hypothetical protein